MKIALGALMALTPLLLRQKANITLGFSFYWWQVLVFTLGVFLLCHGIKSVQISKIRKSYNILKAFYQKKEVVSYEQLAYFMQVKLVEMAALLEAFAQHRFFGAEKIDREKQLLWPEGEGQRAEMPKASTVLIEHKVKTSFPAYAIGGTWFLYALTFPLYRIGDFLAVMALSVLVYLYAQMLWGTQRVFEEKTILEATATGNVVTDEFIEKSHKFLEETKEISRKLQHSKIGATLDETITLAEKLFSVVGTDDQKIRKLQPFIDYYLPTSIKILREYEKISHLPQQGENVSQMKAKIEEVMEKVRKAFGKELDRVYGENTLDMAAEITVLDHMIETEILDKSSK